MKSVIVVVIIAAAAYLLSAYFSHTQPSLGSPSPGVVAAPAPSGGLSGAESGLGPADLHPENIGEQPGGAGHQAAVPANGEPATGHLQHESFALPQGGLPTANRNAHDLKNPDSWSDMKFAKPGDESEPIEAYVPPKPQAPRKKVIAHSDGINDDLLITERHSEDRLSAKK